MTAAKNNFESHISQCRDAISIHEFLQRKGYEADFGLRFVWVASVSALDHYITELIVEKATEHFSNGVEFSSKLSGEGVPLSSLLKMQTMPAAQATFEFRNIMRNAIRFKTFQKADNIADGLAYIWTEKHKWKQIASEIGTTIDATKHKLNSICNRRDLIVHNADFNEATGDLTPCNRADAEEVIDYICKIVEAIDKLVP